MKKYTYVSTTDPAVSEREKRHHARIRGLAPDCMVLLENNGVLPLSAPGRIALFGAGARHTVRGGGGSGTTFPRHAYTVEEGLREAGFTVVTTDWLDRYDNIMNDAVERLEQQKDAGGIGMALMTSVSTLDTAEITAEDLAAGEADTAIYVLTRNSGEGADRTPGEGDYYFTGSEKKQIRTLAEHYPKFILILNVCAPVEGEFLKSCGAGAILSMGMTGAVGGQAVADVLCGKAEPSGHLTDTWAYRYTDYSTANSFGLLSGTKDDVWYEEGLFVGYRYFDSFDITPAYEFGYGLGYTSFALAVTSVSADEEKTELTVKVTNTGAQYSGKETVQVYVSAPKGSLDKPFQVLAAFAKTKHLAPGESERIRISMRTEEFASYSEELAAWCLEPGDYLIRVGTSSRRTFVAAKLCLDVVAVVKKHRNLFADPEGRPEITCRQAVSYHAPGEKEEAAAAPVFRLNAAKFAVNEMNYPEPEIMEDHHSGELITAEMVRKGQRTVEELVAQLTPEELVKFCTGIGKSLDTFWMDEYRVPGAAAQTTDCALETRDIRDAACSDGPAGLHVTPEFVVYNDGTIQELPESGGFFRREFNHSRDSEIAEHHYQYCTAFPAASTLAQSWDTAVLSACGEMYGQEMKEVGIQIALKPSMNIHRDPLGGRNFEYYSEDPLVAGMMAAADIRAIQQYPGIGSTIKHFAVNSQEWNRFHSCAHVSERAIREIYLKGFEIAVRTAQPMCIMTSYNLLNGVHTANSKDLLTYVCRDEWGYQGMIMTDWFTTLSGVDVFAVSDKSSPARHGLTVPHLCMYAGNDIIMPGSDEDRSEILAAMKDGMLSLADLQRCAANVIRTVLHTDIYEDSESWYRCVPVEESGFEAGEE